MQFLQDLKERRCVQLTLPAAPVWGLVFGILLPIPKEGAMGGIPDNKKRVPFLSLQSLGTGPIYMFRCFCLLLSVPACLKPLNCSCLFLSFVRLLRFF